MKYIVIFLFMVFALSSNAQELNCKVTVNAQQINGVDLKIFETLQNSLNTFCNTRKWTNDNFEKNEKIDCNFNLVIQKKMGDNTYEAKLNIQSSRPVFNSDYNSPLVNFADKEVLFKYTQFQPIDFNEQRVSSGDPLVSNLPAIIAYYIYIIIGLDYDSFSEKGGTEMFKKAQLIVTNAPEASGIQGWRATDGNRNRFWLTDNLLNNRFAPVRQELYNIHRLGFDAMSKDVEAAQEIILASIKHINQVFLENPQSHLVQFFFNTKGEEYLNFLKGVDSEKRKDVLPLIAQMDVLNAQKYNALIK